MVIEAGPSERVRLKDHLALTSPLLCQGARVILRAQEAGDLVLELTWKGRRNTRRVQTLEQAAIWLASWLEPPIEPRVRRPRTPFTPRASPSEPTRSVSTARQRETGPRGLRGRVLLSGTGAVAVDARPWAGGELSGRLHILPSLWLGAALGGSWDPAREVGEATVTRRALRASVRGGMKIALHPGLTFSGGIGVGISAGKVSATQATNIHAVEQGGPFAEATVELEGQLAGSWFVVGGSPPPRPGGVLPLLQRGIQRSHGRDWECLRTGV